MKKILFIILSAMVFTSCCATLSAQTLRTAHSRLPEAVSVDPYDGYGTKSQYIRLAREWESKSLNYQANAESCRERMRASSARAIGNAVNAFQGNRNHYGNSSFGHGNGSYSRNYNRRYSGGYGSSYNNSHSRMMRERSRELQLRNRYEEYMEMAMQARAEQAKYLALARLAEN